MSGGKEPNFIEKTKRYIHGFEEEFKGENPSQAESGNNPSQTESGNNPPQAESGNNPRSSMEEFSHDAGEVYGAAKMKMKKAKESFKSGEEKSEPTTSEKTDQTPNDDKEGITK